MELELRSALTNLHRIPSYLIFLLNALLSRYEDNFDALSHLVVIKSPAGGKSSIDAFGSKEEFLQSISYLLGKQAYAGKTNSEGGFDPNKVSAANILESDVVTSNGKKYYKYEVLTRSGEATVYGFAGAYSAVELVNVTASIGCSLSEPCVPWTAHLGLVRLDLPPNIIPCRRLFG